VIKEGRTFRTGPYKTQRKEKDKLVFKEEGFYHASSYGTSKEILSHKSYNSGKLFRSFKVEGTWVFVKEQGSPEACNLISKNDFHEIIVGKRISSGLGKDQLKAVAEKTQVLVRGDIASLIEPEFIFDVDCSYEGNADAGFEALRDKRQVHTNRGEGNPIEQNDSEDVEDKKLRAKQK
jgi:hypothetical protein